MKILPRAKTGHEELFIMAIIISIPIYLMFVLLFFNCYISYWLFLENIISDLLSFVLLKSLQFSNFILVWINSFICKKFA